MGPRAKAAVIYLQRGSMANRRNGDVDSEIFERQAMICKAFAHATRLRILDLLGKGERPLAEVQKALGVPKANVSQHLAVLRAAGVIATHRVGSQVHIAIAMPEVRQACHLVREVLREQVRGQTRLAR